MRVVFFDPAFGLGLTVAAGSGRSWVDQPDGDPVHAHCTLDVPADTLLPSLDEPRLTSGTLLVPWGELTAFAARLEGLQPGETVRLGTRFTSLAVRMRRDGRLKAEAVFTQGHHVTSTLRCSTRWDWHNGTRDDLPALADRLRTAAERKGAEGQGQGPAR